jgi:hypothetical protein
LAIISPPVFYRFMAIYTNFFTGPSGMPPQWIPLMTGTNCCPGTSPHDFLGVAVIDAYKTPEDWAALLPWNVKK